MCTSLYDNICYCSYFNISCPDISCVFSQKSSAQNFSAHKNSASFIYHANSKLFLSFPFYFFSHLRIAIYLYLFVSCFLSYRPQLQKQLSCKNHTHHSLIHGTFTQRFLVFTTLWVLHTFIAIDYAAGWYQTIPSGGNFIFIMFCIFNFNMVFALTMFFVNLNGFLYLIHICPKIKSALA